MWLFDTVALSEARKPRANAQFLAWLDTVPTERIYTSVLCLGEIRRGAEKLVDGQKKHELSYWLEIDLPHLLGERVLPVDHKVAQIWGRMSAIRTLSLPDALIAATAKAANLSIVTRNVRDFDGLGVPVLNPWY